LRIALLTETYSRRMGYIFHCLPKYLARCGVEVHVITMDLPPYYYISQSTEVFQGFTEPLVPGTTEEIDGYHLHVLKHRKVFGYPRMVGLADKLGSIRPDIVQCQASIGLIPMDAALNKLRFGYKLFTGNHNAMSTASAGLGIGGSFLQRGKAFATRFLSGRLASYCVERCYAVTCDCAEIAWRYYGVQKRKVVTMHLGVDIDYFFPVRSVETQEERVALRKELGYTPEEIVCVYSGKMTEDKNALILAQAVNRIRELGIPYSALFIGNGVQKEGIGAMAHCKVLDFMDFSKLGAYYRALEIGVWPTNESTSMLDAAACGIPLIISDGVVYREHVDGNGLVYHQNDLDDLVSKLLELNSKERRSQLGKYGADKMVQKFSWDSVARRRLAHYHEALG
jgi:glycosyltransferase involved in cell wall biosynthesis